MPDRTPEDNYERIGKVIALTPFMKHLGMEFLEGGEGYAKLREHIEQAALDQLVVRYRDASLNAVAGVGERLLEGGAGHTAERRAHARVGLRQQHVGGWPTEASRLREHVVPRDAHVVEEA